MFADPEQSFRIIQPDLFTFECDDALVMEFPQGVDHILLGTPGKFGKLLPRKGKHKFVAHVYILRKEDQDIGNPAVHLFMGKADEIEDGTSENICNELKHLKQV